MFEITAVEPTVARRFLVSERQGQFYVCDVLRQMAPEKCHNFSTARAYRDELNARYCPVP